MEEGDYDTMHSYFALNKYRLMPWDYAALDDAKKIMLDVMIDERIKSEKKKMKELEKKSKK